MILFLLIAVVSFLVQFFLPWWSMAVVAFVFSFLLGKKPWEVFLAGFFGCGLVWLVMAEYIHFTRGDLMTDKIAALFSLHGTVALYVVTFLLAGVIGTAAALTGIYFRDIIWRK